jgi:hypothetical protein
MATITGLTAARMLLIEAASVISGAIVGDDLILTKKDNSTINAGNVRGPAAARNRIINGDFAVNQRGFTTTNVDTAYGFDGWKLFKSGTSVTYQAQTPALGDLPESAKAFARVISSAQAAAGDYAILVQRIESVRVLSGKTATISFWARAASGTPKVSVMLAQFFGSGGSPSTQVDTYAGQVTLSTTWVRYSVTIAVPSIAGKTLGTDASDSLGLWLWTSAGSNNNARTGSLGLQNTTIDFWGVQVEDSPKATPFEQEEYAVNLRRCQRYYYRASANGSSYGAFGFGIGSTSTSVYFQVPLPNEMRITPQISWVAGSLATDDRTAIIAGTTLTSSVNRATCKVGHANLNVSGGIVVGKIYEIIANNSPLTAIEFTAEL